MGDSHRRFKRERRASHLASSFRKRTNYPQLALGRAALEGYSVDVVLIIIGRGPPAPPIARHGAVYCAIITQTPPMAVLFEGLRGLRALA